MKLRKGYSDGPQGQVHWRMAEPDSAVSQPDLYCFSPAPLGSIAYAAILPYLAGDRRVIAPDYPGQGGSDGDSLTPSIEDYAASMLAIVQDLSESGQIAVTGFHSGSLVATELALQDADRIQKNVLVDVPAFDRAAREKYLPILGKPFDLSADLESMAKAWETAVTKRTETQPLSRSLEMFADLVGNGARMNATFHAAFTYDVEAKLSSLSAETIVIASQSSLLEASRRAADLIPNCELIEVPEITRSVLDENAEETARTILSALD